MRAIPVIKDDRFSESLDLPNLPENWKLSFEVSFTLLPNSCVYQGLYTEYAVSSLNEAVSRIFKGEGDEIFPGYRAYIEDFMPPFKYNACWPLRRRGSTDGLLVRSEIPGVFPWESLPDDTILALWEKPRGVWGFSSTLMLQVGGATPEDATANWLYFAKPLRAILKRLQADR